jgi:hypothetical protein
MAFRAFGRQTRPRDRRDSQRAVQRFKHQPIGHEHAAAVGRRKGRDCQPLGMRVDFEGLVCEQARLLLDAPDRPID